MGDKSLKFRTYPLPSVLTIAIMCFLSSCNEAPSAQAVKLATEYARNSVGDEDAPIWQTVYCYYRIPEKDMVAVVSGLINAHSKGSQRFVVYFKPDGTPDGEVELRPLTFSDEGTRMYWAEMDNLADRDSGKRCHPWLEYAVAAGSVYSSTISNDADPVNAVRLVAKTRAAMDEMYKDKDEIENSVP